ncbi:tail attachment protein [Salmonella enterica subsp. enterica serovar Choleraesuis]|nr:tail attachment protein [Salmonella enterica subsp. enterica serovar Choleraesuis]
MADFDSLFDAAISRADGAILDVMGCVARITSGAISGRDIHGVFDDPENVAYAGSGVRIEGTAPSLFVKTPSVIGLQRLDTIAVNGESFWVDRVTPDDCGSCYVWLGRGQPPTGNRRR